MTCIPEGQKLGRNQPCWCGSGVKYKNCHLNRDFEKPVTRTEALQGFFSSFSAKECLCPDDWKSQCSGNIVRAHSISRRNALMAVTEAGHVFSFTPDWGQLFHKNQFVLKEKSARDASTFTGFCGYHDNTIFASLDRQDFDGSAELTVLSAYRTLCQEIFMKNAHLRTTELAKTMDKGSSPIQQLLLQEAVSGVVAGAESPSSNSRIFERSLKQRLRHPTIAPLPTATSISVERLTSSARVYLTQATLLAVLSCKT